MYSLVIPVFNEEKNISNLIQEILKHLKGVEFEIIIVNDCSTDKSAIALSKYEQINNIKIINNTFNKGQSYSIANGIKNSKFDIIITLDGDGQNNPIDIPKLIKTFNSNKVKLVGGIRRYRKDSLVKKISSRIANLVRKTYLKDDCNDTGCGLKIFEKKAFLELEFFDGIHRFLPALFKGNNHSCKFVEVNHRIRKYGISKYGTTTRMFKGIKDMIYVKHIIKESNRDKKK